MRHMSARLEQLPEAIGQFKRLRALDVCGNRLVALPNQLMFLTRLQVRVVLRVVSCHVCVRLV